MIFLFFGSPVALLEPDLDCFLDRPRIHRFVDLPRVGSRLMVTMMIFDKSSTRANSVSRGATEEPKKGKSSEFDGRDDGWIKKSLSLIVWAHEGSKHTSKFGKYGY